MLTRHGWDDRSLTHHKRKVGTMVTPVSYRLRLDEKRRPTLPQPLLDAAELGADQDLVARVEGPGRIVLEGTAAVLVRLQEAVRSGKAAHGSSGRLADEILADRATDTSLDR